MEDQDALAMESPTVYRPPRTFSFVMNVASIEADSAVEIAPGLQLRKATESEREEIKVHLQRHAPPHLPEWPILWENRFVQNKDGAFDQESLPPDQFRYFVLDAENGNALVNEFILCQTFSQIGLEIGFTFSKGFGFIFFPEQLFQHQHRFCQEWNFCDLSRNDLELLRREFESFSKHDNERVDIRRTADQLRLLEGVSDRSPLKFLGYFGELERLLTHKPNPSDRYDSIIRQVTFKLQLLVNRTPKEFGGERYSAITHKKLWELMYDYRSSIAHGTPADFSGQLQALISAEDSFDFLRRTLHGVMRQCVVDPQLLRDLKNC